MEGMRAEERVIGYVSRRLWARKGARKEEVKADCVSSRLPLQKTKDEDLFVVDVQGDEHGVCIHPTWRTIY